MVVKRIKVKCICNLCGKEYYVSKSQLNRTKFCSDECFRKSRNTQIDYTCEYCGKDFKIPLHKYYALQNGIRKHLFCSAQCAKYYQKPKFSDIQKLFEDKGYILLSTEYINAKSKLDYICTKHKEYGIQSIRYNNLKHGFGCKYCGRESQIEKRKLTFEQIKAIFERNDMELLDQEYHNTTQKLKYICKKHPQFGIQYMIASNAYKQHCPHCNYIRGEAKISEFLLNHNIPFEAQKKYDDLLGIKGHKLSYDFYLPSYNMLIEYQGEYHDGTVPIQTKENFLKQQEHDKRKFEYAKQHNITLLQIWYYDFSQIDKILTDKLLN